MPELITWLLFVLVILMSSFFSGSEIVFLKHQKLKAKVWSSNNKKYADKLLFFNDNPDVFLSTILIGNNLINTSYTAIGTLLFIPFINENNVVIVLAIIILVFGEILPKVIATYMADSLVLRIMPVIHFCKILMTPLIIAISKFSKLFMKQSAMQEEQARQEADLLFTIGDFESMIVESHDSGVVDLHEKEYISNVISLNETKVKEIMTPRVDMTAIEVDADFKKMRKELIKSGHSKIPVYEQHMDNIIGLVYIYDILKDKVKPLKQLVKDCLYIPETKRCRDLLIDLRKQNRTSAIVLDEYGGTAGIVTMTDLIEVILGELESDSASTKKQIQISENIYKVSGRITLDELENIGFELTDGDYETIAGYILDYLGRFPKLFEEIENDGYKMTVMNLSNKRVQWVRIERLTEE